MEKYYNTWNRFPLNGCKAACFEQCGTLSKAAQASCDRWAFYLSIGKILPEMKGRDPFSKIANFAITAFVALPDDATVWSGVLMNIQKEMLNRLENQAVEQNVGEGGGRP
jgi:hypothetical protein